MPTWDISFPIRDRMPGFPGDPAVQVTPVRRLDRGDAYDLSSLAMSSHTGTHLDPPRHFIPGAVGVDRLDPVRFNGPARVVVLPPEATVVDGIQVGRIPAGTERVLFRTRNSERWDRSEAFFEDYVALDDTAAEELVRRRVGLVGLDALSIERDSTGKFPVHHTLLGGGALILEGLRLSGVPEGEYELRCLPLRIADGDGGPARALLWSP